MSQRVMNAWIECPSCKGVMKISAPELQGACVFCRAQIRVSLRIEMATGVIGQIGVDPAVRPRHEVGRGPTPKFRPLPKKAASSF